MAISAWREAVAAMNQVASGWKRASTTGSSCCRLPLARHANRSAHRTEALGGPIASEQVGQQLDWMNVLAIIARSWIDRGRKIGPKAGVIRLGHVIAVKIAVLARHALRPLARICSIVIETHRVKNHRLAGKWVHRHRVVCNLFGDDFGRSWRLRSGLSDRAGRYAAAGGSSGGAQAQNGPARWSCHGPRNHISPQNQTLLAQASG